MVRKCMTGRRRFVGCGVVLGGVVRHDVVCHNAVCHNVVCCSGVYRVEARPGLNETGTKSDHHKN